MHNAPAAQRRGGRRISSTTGKLLRQLFVDDKLGRMPAPGPTSLVDAVDETNEPVGVVARSEVFQRQANFRTVHVLVFDSAGRLLVQQLSASRDRHPLRWGSSVAGYLHAGETYEAAARRRLHEELGVDAPVVSLGVISMADDGVTKFVGVFTARADHPRIGEPDHIAGLQFLSPDYVRTDLDSRPDRYTVTLREVLARWEKIDGGVG